MPDFRTAGLLAAALAFSISSTGCLFQSKRPRPAVQPPKPEGPPLPQPPAPKITQVFPAEQLREYTREFDESMDRARRALEVLAKRNVPAGDQAEVERIRTFVSQAEQARPSDLVTAARLARAADLLAKDLLDRLQ